MSYSMAKHMEKKLRDRDVETPSISFSHKNNGKEQNV